MTDFGYFHWGMGFSKFPDGSLTRRGALVVAVHGWGGENARVEAMALAVG